MPHNERYKSSIVGLYFRMRHSGITQSRYKILLVRINPRFVTEAYCEDLVVKSEYLIPILDGVSVPTFYSAYQFPSALLLFLSLFRVSIYDKGFSYHMKNKPKI